MTLLFRLQVIYYSRSLQALRTLAEAYAPQKYAAAQTVPSAAGACQCHLRHHVALSQVSDAHVPVLTL